MIKIRAIHSVPARIRYHKLSPALTDDEKRGMWLGSGLSAVGLAQGQPVAIEEFASLMNGYALDGTYLGQQRKANRRASWDAVVSPHKSISVSAFCIDEALASNVREAWTATTRSFADALDALAARQNAGLRPVPTGNTIIAAFIHTRSRHDDPQIHTHFLVMNATLDRTDPRGPRWRSLEPSPIFRNHVALDRAFNRELLRELRARGLAASLDAKGRAFLPQVDASVCQRLSKAHAAIARLVTTNPIPPPRPGEKPMPLCKWENYLNDRFRPAKNIDPPPLQILVFPREKQLIELRLRQSAPPPPPPLKRPPQHQVAAEVQRVYQSRSIYHTPQALFSAAVETARHFVEWPLKSVLSVLAIVRERARPRQSLSPAEVALRAAQAQQLAERRQRTAPIARLPRHPERNPTLDMARKAAALRMVADRARARHAAQQRAQHTARHLKVRQVNATLEAARKAAALRMVAERAHARTQALRQGGQQR